MIERNPVIEGELGSDELEGFIEDVGRYRPASGAGWLKRFLPTVKVIYAFQLLSGTEANDGFELLQTVYQQVWNTAGGILQADGEGFSNEKGFTILWQFADHVSGPWEVGVLDQNGEWINFGMELGDPVQRESFLNGEVPAGAISLPLVDPASS